MFRAARFQFVTALVVAAMAGTIAGGHAALSALLGGLACVLPNGMFALHVALLSRKRQGPGGASDARAAGSAANVQALAILLGEFFKVLLTLALLALVAVGDRETVWPALIASLCAVLLVQPAAFMGRRA